MLILPPYAAAAPERDLLTVLRETLAEGTLTRKAAVKQVAKEFGVASDEVYRLSLTLETR